MSFKDFFKSNHLNKILIVLATIVVLVFVFSLGVFVGHEKGRFSRNWGENYYRNIMGPGGFGGPGMMDFNRPDFNAHGGLGQIIKIDGNNLIIKDQASVEKIILVTGKTIITKNNQNIKITDLKVDDKIVVIGGPNDQGQIEPKLIRVLPELPPIQQN
ncbi:MAG: hypothetical protein WC349_04795 [Patescibacteria group bacterium]|jgi:hypothetical protein